jgi:predicted aldo/keto reductase-like oxidoreductase
MEKRELGRTGEALSVVGFGGILVMDETPDESSRRVAAAVDRGINYFDVAPSYGNAEERLGPALEPYRNSVFLACKSEERSAEAAARELEQSLKNLRTDHFDLYQLHAVLTEEDVQQILAPGGALETLVKAREEGLVRFLGFSAHSEEAALALLDAFAFDSVLFPFNWVIWHQGNFGARVLAAAQEKGAGLLALKAMHKRKLGEEEERPWPKAWYVPVEDATEAALALRFVLSKPITAAVSPGHYQFFDWMCQTAADLEPLSAQEEAFVAERSRGLEPIFPF